MPNSARVWNYWLGGKDDFRADREVGDRIRAVLPGVVDAVRGDREFLIRELEEGMLVMSPQPTPRHQRCIRELESRAARDRGLPVTVVWPAGSHRA